MASTILVLVTPLIVGAGHLVLWLVSFVATSRLAKRNGQRIKSMSKSLVHGFQVEFFEDSQT
jgi:hypothetical protein